MNNINKKIINLIKNNKNIADNLFLYAGFPEDILKQYEQWCKENGIELDQNRIYHDQNGNLFTHYFDKID